MLKAVAAFVALAGACLFCAWMSGQKGDYAGIYRILMFVFAVLAVIPARIGRRMMMDKKQD